MKTLTITLILLIATAAQAVPTFSNAVGGSDVAYGPTTIRWGLPYHQPNQSGLEWIEEPLTPSSTPFILGELIHSNFPQKLNTSISQVDLNTHGLSFTLLVNETPNVGGPVDDIISFPLVMPPASFEILGFGPTPDNILSYFASAENGMNSTYCWAEVPERIPVPGAFVLAVFGWCLCVRRRLG